MATITMSTERRVEPYSWLMGCLYVVGSGILISAILDPFTYEGALFALSFYQGIFPAFERPLIGLLFLWVVAFPVAAVAAVVPLTVSYAAVRHVARNGLMTTTRRICWGATLGIVTNLIVFSGMPGRLQNESWSSSALADLLFPMLEIQVSAVAIALAVRPRWFGVE